MLSNISEILCNLNQIMTNESECLVFSRNRNLLYFKLIQLLMNITYNNKTSISILIILALKLSLIGYIPKIYSYILAILIFSFNQRCLLIHNFLINWNLLISVIYLINSTMNLYFSSV